MTRMNLVKLFKYFGWCLIFAGKVSLPVTSVIHENDWKQVTCHFEKILKALESTTTIALTPQS